MVSEKICLDIISLLHGRTTTSTQTWHPGRDNERVTQTEDTDALAAKDLYRLLLADYDLTDIDAAVRWLELGAYLGKSYPMGMVSATTGLYVYVLTDKGREVARNGQFSDAERGLFHQEDPYAVFVAHQFNEDDEELVLYIENELLVPKGFKPLYGKAEGLEEFRTSILGNIKEARFFLCLLTKRAPLESGRFTSSVWLYQEIGAAMAFGKKPLILVEEGLDHHFAGELQSIYEFIAFSRSNYTDAFGAIIPRLNRDLDSNLIPLPG